MRRAGPPARRATAMHELSVMTQVVESVLGSLEGRDVRRVESVRLEVGELTMLGKEQLRFAWGVLSRNGPLRGSKLVIIRKPAVVECPGCGFRGAPKKAPAGWSHTVAPLIACPRCGGEVRIVGGRETVVRSLRAVAARDRRPGKRRGR